MSEHITEGVFDMAASQYFASDAVSNSDLKWIAPPYTPAHFRAFKAGQIERTETEAMRIGTLTHRCILEPDKMSGSYVVKPEGFDGRTSAGKAWVKEQGENLILSKDHADMIARMVESVWKHTEAKALISGSNREKSLFAQDGELWMKGRVDCLTKGGNIIADLKTCELSDLDSVEASIFKYGYYRQAAYYLRLANMLGLEKSRFVFIFVEKTPPHCVACYSLGDTALQAGEAEIEASLSLLKFCKENDRWPGREGGINEASLPNWAMKQIENTL